MRQRCSNPDSKDWPYYGGRGIKVCERWQTFAPFLEDMGLKPTRGHTIGRIDNTRGYSPDNCEWQTRKQQMRNMRGNKGIIVAGQVMTLVEASELTGIKAATLSMRLLRGQSDKRATREWQPKR